MPGDYGPGGKWIHDRAHRIMEEDPETKKEVAYAIATQQAHKVGKSPKDFRTAEGVHEAKKKYDEPKSEYQKTASESEATKQKRMRTNKAKALGGLAGIVPGAGAAVGAERLLRKVKALRNLGPAAQLALGTALGAGGVTGGVMAGSRIGKAISKHRQAKEEREKRAMLEGLFDELEKIALVGLGEEGTARMPEFAHLPVEGGVPSAVQESVTRHHVNLPSYTQRAGIIARNAPKGGSALKAGAPAAGKVGRFLSRVLGRGRG